MRRPIFTIGSTLLEVIIAVAIFSIVAGALIIMSLGSLTAMAQRQDRLTATFLAQQGLEAARAIRNRNFSELTPGNHGVTDVNGYFEWSGVSDTLGRFTRQLTVNTIDPLTSDVTATVNWNTTQSVSLVTRLTDWKQFSWIQTLTTDFDLGTLNQVQVIPFGDGAVRLADNAPSGTFISQSFDTTATSTTYRTLSWNAVVPASATLRFQIRTASNAASLPAAIWVGPNGTNTTYYTNSGTTIVPDPGASGRRFFQFQAFFDSNSSSKPRLDDLTVTY